ncbi:hypothetical protein C8R44DRAFT_746172 [Mycena epipterygia]|nr:hypothetical protein C8R44DRAFT_746172 [Mycena epipterygia]
MVEGQYEQRSIAGVNRRPSHVFDPVANLARIFQARWLLHHPRFDETLLHLWPFGGGEGGLQVEIAGSHTEVWSELFFIHILLDLSWVDMRTAIYPLRPILGEEPQQFGEMLLILPTLCSEIHLESYTSRDLALGFLRLMQKICRKVLPVDLWCNFKESGMVHDCQNGADTSDLLRTQAPNFYMNSDCDYETYLRPIEFHDVVRWLKESPDPPLELIERWQGYLEEIKSMCRGARGCYLTDEKLEYYSKCRRVNRRAFNPPS